MRDNQRLVSWATAAGQLRSHAPSRPPNQAGIASTGCRDFAAIAGLPRGGRGARRAGFPVSLSTEDCPRDLLTVRPCRRARSRIPNCEGRCCPTRSDSDRLATTSQRSSGVVARYFRRRSAPGTLRSAARDAPGYHTGCSLRHAVSHAILRSGRTRGFALVRGQCFPGREPQCESREVLWRIRISGLQRHANGPLQSEERTFGLVDPLLIQPIPPARATAESTRARSLQSPGHDLVC